MQPSATNPPPKAHTIGSCWVSRRTQESTPSTYRAEYEDDVFLEARDWLRAILATEPGAGD